MDDVLLGIVLGRLAESPLSDQAADLLLAALDGDESLSAQLTGQAQPRSAAPAVATSRHASRRLPAVADGQRIPGDRPARDFSGVAAPGADPGGRPQRQREVELRRSARGTAHREPAALGEAAAVWKQGWRSVHQPDQAKITAEFVVEGAGPATAQRTWPAGADFAASAVAVQVSGEKQAGIERLGWTAALTDYRPFLSHSELEAFFGSSSGLYELLASVLGLEDLAVAAARLAQARRAREAGTERGQEAAARVAGPAGGGRRRARPGMPPGAGRAQLGPGRGPVGCDQFPGGGRSGRARPASPPGPAHRAQPRPKFTRSRMRCGSPPPSSMPSRARPRAGRERWPGC